MSPQGPLLQGDEHVRIHFRDDSFRWIDIRHFHTVNASMPGDVVRGLIAHPSYRDNYLSSDAKTTDHVHGPYRLESVTLDAFELLDVETALAIFDAWVQMYPLSEGDTVEGDLAAVYRLFREARTCWHLRPLGENEFHELGFVLGPFVEFVLESANRLSLVVASSD